MKKVSYGSLLIHMSNGDKLKADLDVAAAYTDFRQLTVRTVEKRRQ